MKKILIILIALFMVAGCSNNENTSFDDDVVIDEESETREKTNQDITIDIWDINPIYEFDDIDVDFVFTYRDAFSKTQCIYSNIDSLYEYVDSGGLIITKNNHIGLLNGEGIIKTQPIFKRINKYDVGRDEDYEIFAVQLLTDYNNFYWDNNYDCFYLEKDYSFLVENGVGGVPLPNSYGVNNNNQVVEDYFDYNTNSYKKNNVVNYSQIAELLEVFDDKPFIIDSHKGTNNEYLDVFALIYKDDSIKLLERNDYNFKTYSNDILLFVRNKDNSNLQDNDNEVVSVIYYDNKANLIGEYDNGYGFYEGYAPVKKDGKCGYIDKQNNVVIDFIFDKATPLCDGKAWVIYNGRTGRLNIKDMLDNNVPFTDEILNADGYERNNNWIKVVADIINIRENYSIDSKKIGKVEKDMVFYYFEKFEDDNYIWYKIGENRWIADKNGERITTLD